MTSATLAPSFYMFRLFTCTSMLEFRKETSFPWNMKWKFSAWILILQAPIVLFWFLKRKDAVRTSQTFSGHELNHHITENSPLPNANTCVRFSWSYCFQEEGLGGLKFGNSHPASNAIIIFLNHWGLNRNPCFPNSPKNHPPKFPSPIENQVPSLPWTPLSRRYRDSVRPDQFFLRLRCKPS